MASVSSGISSIHYLDYHSWYINICRHSAPLVHIQGLERKSTCIKGLHIKWSIHFATKRRTAFTQGAVVSLDLLSPDTAFSFLYYKSSMWDVYCTGATLQTAVLMLGWAQLSSPSTSWVAICGGAVCMNIVVNVVEKINALWADSWFDKWLLSWQSALWHFAIKKLLQTRVWPGPDRNLP